MNRPAAVLGRASLVAMMAVTIVMAANPADGLEQPTPAKPMKSRILVHVTHGPEHPTRAALAFLVAKSALDEGHAVTLFLAGDAVLLVRDAVLDSVSGVGTGKLRDSYEAIVKGGGRFYLSGMSSQARGLAAAELAGKPAEFAQPAVLVKLSLEHDRMFTY
jgi:predicted peroxiredoxin